MTDKPSNAEIAHALMLALKSGLIDHLVVRKWVDEIIAASDSTEPWMLDLSFCSPNDAAFHLCKVPSNPRMQVVHDTLIVLATAVDESGAIDWFNLRDINWTSCINAPCVPGYYYASTHGEVSEPSTPAELASALNANGISADYNRTSTRVVDCSRFRFCFSDGYANCLDAGAENIAQMLVDARLISKAMTNAGIKHRFEVYGHNDRQVEYLHHNWPQEAKAG